MCMCENLMLTFKENLNLNLKVTILNFILKI